MVTAVVGANWGDEGKGKITDMLADEADIVIRFQGGANAGHTIVNNYGKFALHTLPSGVFHSHITNIIGNGVALDIPKVIGELKSITDRNVPAPKLMISDRAQMVMPYHVLFDQYEEERLGKNSFGSTKSGIAPFYSDKYAKIGFQVSELFDEELLKEKVKRTCETKNIMLEHMYHKPLLKEEELLATLHEYRDMVAPYVGDVSLFLDQAIKDGKRILLEGQLGTLKDPDHGIYPMVTSSSTLAAYGAIGAGIPPYEIKKIVTVCKAYSSAVRSTRGPQGGYSLRKAPEEYTVGDILRLTEGSLAPVACVEEEGSCEREVDCVTVEVWKRLNQAISDVVDHITLADLVALQEEKREKSGLDFGKDI